MHHINMYGACCHPTTWQSRTPALAATFKALLMAA